MSGRDERPVDTTRCPGCKKKVRSWALCETDDNRPTGYYNCLSKHGPMYRYSGLVDDILAFRCTKCMHRVERGERRFDALLRSMVKTKRYER